MNDPAILVLLLEQGDCSLEDHTTDFVFLANLTHYPDSCLCSFFQAGLNTAARALSGEGPRESLTAYVEAQPTITRFTEHEPEPTADGEPEPSMTDEPSPQEATVLRISPEPEPITSNQVQEPAISHVTVEVTVAREGAEESPAHCTISEAMPPLSPDSLSAHPHPTISLVPPTPPWSVIIPPSPQDSTPPDVPRRSVLDPSVSSLAPPSIVTTLDFVCCPHPRSSFSASASSCTDFLLPSHVHDSYTYPTLQY
ncbi:Filamentous hemagglutinin [Labeo rohita]|uniref:Filamentous hemagglutinin n=1 Tax=Labeo rohita TaxID=84645 RepID=A0ABQ8MM25_LABRO|nr:Filamentous hemagglutinin [Labeo rohita]